MLPLEDDAPTLVDVDPSPIPLEPDEEPSDPLVESDVEASEPVLELSARPDDDPAELVVIESTPPDVASLAVVEPVAESTPDADVTAPSPLQPKLARTLHQKTRRTNRTDAMAHACTMVESRVTTGREDEKGTVDLVNRAALSRLGELDAAFGCAW